MSPMEDDDSIRLLTIESADKKASVVISTYGAAIVKLILPATSHEESKTIAAQPVDIALGYRDLASYQVNAPSLGVVVGRVAGRISEAQFRIRGQGDQIHQVTRNLQNTHCLHGGLRGLYHVNWNLTFLDDKSVTLGYTSPDGEDGFPGSMHVELTYRFDQAQLNDQPIYWLSLAYKASVRNAPCPINLTNHSYFNLAGHNSGREGLESHHVQVCSDKTLELDSKTLLPTGKIIQAVGHKDLATGRMIREGIENGGYDLFYILGDGKVSLQPELERITGACQAFVQDSKSGRALLCQTDQLGIQFYTADCLDPGTQPAGKHGEPYEKFGGFCLETQAHPNASNIPEFPSIDYWPSGDKYSQNTTFYFYDSNTIRTL